MGVPIVVEPGNVIEPDGIYDKCVTFPFAHGVAIPGELWRVFRKLTSISPNFSPIMVLLEDLQHPVGKHEDLEWMWRTEYLRNPIRIAPKNRIILFAGHVPWP